MSIRTPVLLATVIAVALGAGAPAHAQTTPTVFTFCYMPSNGAVYRIGTPDTPDSCLSPRHVEFSWTDGVPGHDHGALNGLSDDDHPEYVREGEAAAGDLSGAYPAPTVRALRGHGVAAATPTEGQLLTFTGGAWTPTTPDPSGISFADLLGLDGAGSGLDADLLDGKQASAFASVAHDHDAVYAADAHDHDSDYYTEAESDARYVQKTAAGGDLGGAYPAPTVVGLRGGPLAATAPQTGDLLGWDGSAWTPTAPAAGGITAVSAGAGLTGGGSAGTATLSHADASRQASVNNSGTTVIQDLAFDAFGHTTGVNSVDLSASLQRRVTGACSVGSSIRAIAADGTVTCEPDDAGTGYVSNYEVVQTSWVPDGSSPAFLLRASCPLGTKVTGGGFRAGTTAMEVLRSYPVVPSVSSQPYGWEIYVVDNSATKDYLAEVYALCARMP